MRIIDEDGLEIDRPDESLGRLVADRLLVAHHEAEPELRRVEVIDYDNPVYVAPNGGKIVNTIVEREYSPPKDAWDEYEDVLRYVPYTPDELAAMEAERLAQEQARKEAEKRAAEQAREAAAREEFMAGAPARMEAAESVLLDHDEAIVVLSEAQERAQLDADEAIVPMYELIGGAGE